MTNKKLTIYEYLKDIYTTKSGTLCDRDDFNNTFVPYIIIRFISMRKDSLHVAALANHYQTSMTKKQMYKFLVATVPHSKNSFVKYIAKPKVKEETND
jgi:hypothetical protein